MKKFVLEKLLNKKWMCLCLLIGNVLFLSIAISNPLYYHGALNRTLQKYLANVSNTDGMKTGEVSISGNLKLNDDNKISETFYTGDYKNLNDVPEAVEESYGLKALESQTIVTTGSSTIESMTYVESIGRTDKFSVGMIKNLKEHATLIDGDWGDDVTSVDGEIPCIVHEHTLMERGLMIGQEIELNQMVNSETGENLKLKIVGVFANKEGDDFWMSDGEDFYSQLFVNEELFSSIEDKIEFSGSGIPSAIVNVLFNTEDITDYNFQKLINRNDDLVTFFKKNKSFVVSTGFIKCLNEYKENRNSVKLIMLIFEIPLIILVGLFVYMVSSQMISMETNEIALLKSRGSSRMQIIKIYTLQSGAISLLSTILAIPLGIFICKLLGCAESFMKFVNRDTVNIGFSWDVVMYIILGNLFLIGIMVLPVIKLSRLSIVESKLRVVGEKPSLWRKFFLDVIILVVTGYIYYNYYQQKDTMSIKVASGGDVDYLLLLSSSMFMIGFGLLAIRLVPWLVRLVFTIGKRFWKPEIYASFIQVIRTRKKQEIISLFLIMTVSMGIFNATTAGTISENQAQELEFANGTDIVLQENFDSNKAQVQYCMLNYGTDSDIVYQEPSYEKYDALRDDVTAISRVYTNVGTVYTYNQETETSKQVLNVNYMAIEPKEFGESCYYRDDLSDEHWYNYLNLLADDPNGVLISKAMAKKYGLKVGDEIDTTLPDELGRDKYTTYGNVVGIVEYWPTLYNTTTELDEDGNATTTENYFVIADFETLMGQTAVQPYSIYIKTKNDNADPVYDFIEENNLSLASFTDTINEELKAKSDPVFQATNGILTISFLVVMILCATGFLIYWIMSLRSRELLFGIYRAMGLSKGELNKMLVNEHIFSTLISLIIGGVIGVAASKIYVPIMEITYLPGSQIIPMNIVVDSENIIKLAVVIGIMLLVLIIVLMKLLSKLKIASALKLGED